MSDLVGNPEARFFHDTALLEHANNPITGELLQIDGWMVADSRSLSTTEDVNLLICPSTVDCQYH